MNMGTPMPAIPAGYHLGMWIFSILGILGVVFAFLLRQRENGAAWAWVGDDYYGQEVEPRDW